VEQVARRLGRSVAAVRADAAAGRLPGAEKVGWSWVIPESALEQFVKPRMGRRPVHPEKEAVHPQEDVCSP
jgi:hypothetical protein